MLVLQVHTMPILAASMTKLLSVSPMAEPKKKRRAPAKKQPAQAAVGASM